ncbi:MAG: hypothetical protein KAJ10_11720 [Thermodesulfovibrionia bacterium]|nr:hypothetical protein [Thermodesulfovibrionia bacterium]
MPPHEPETVRHVVEQFSFWHEWKHELAAGFGVVILFLLKLLGYKELERRKLENADYVSTTDMDGCKTEIIRAFKTETTINKARIDHIEDRLDDHLNNVGGHNGDSTG